MLPFLVFTDYVLTFIHSVLFDTRTKNMSLLSDLLSNIKHSAHKANVPPGLAATVKNQKRKTLRAKKLIMIIACVSILLIGSMVTLYLLPHNRLTHPQSTGIQPRGVGPQDNPSRPEPDKAIQNKPAEKQASRAPAPAVVQKKPAAQPNRKRSSPVGNPALQTAGTAAIKAAEVSAQKAKPNNSRPVAEQPAPDLSSRDYYLYTGDTYEKNGECGKALIYYKKAAAITPEDYRLHNKIAYLFITMSLHEDALVYVKNALELKADYVPALINRGIISASRQQYAEAEKYFLQVLSLEETNRAALHNIVLVYHRIKKLKQAAHYKLKLEAVGPVE